jgi:CheY-like chemotaxis protein/CheY-specific phosphatase CheX
MTDIDPDLLAECTELLASLRDDLEIIRWGSDDPEVLQRAHRSAHTVKGLVSFLDNAGMTEEASFLSNELRKFRDGEATATSEMSDVLGTRLESLSGMLQQLERAATMGDAATAGDTAAAGRGETGDKRRTLITSAQEQERIARQSAEAARAGSSSWDMLAAAAAQQKVSILSRAFVEVLKSFAIEGSLEGNDYVRRILTTTGDLTVIMDLHGDHEGSVVMTFDAKAARAIADAVAVSMMGEQIEVSPEEEEEYVNGSLGELANRATNKWNDLSKTTGDVGAPRFVAGKDKMLAKRPTGSRGFAVSTPLGFFEVCFAPGAALSEGREASPAEAGGEPAKKRIVIADDSIVMRKTIARALTEAGIEVVAQANNGRVAVEEVRRHRPDLTIMDINMPEMSGLDALRVIRAEDPKARVLICSAIAESGTISRGLKSGAIGYVTKPFESTKLVEAVVHLMSPQAIDGGVKATEPSPLRVDRLGPYRVGDLLGDGGMADVYKGEDVSLGRAVALKVIKDQFASNADFVVRFLNEARAMAKVTHPNVVSVYYAGSDSGKHFFAMEFLEGPDLEVLVEKKGPLQEKEALNYIVQAACGLAAAASQKLVHCDVKPSNLMLYAGGLLKVTDFGIAQAVSDMATAQDPDILGTPWFMSPEQVLGNPMDFRSDIYALGATLFSLIAGVPPFEGDDMVEVALRQVHEPLPPLPSASRKVTKLVSRMMAKAPEARHGSYEELLAEIRRLL